ncbi:PQQ-dependent sugar dehydrogenase [Lacipirellula sp.]|uniref:PQQ-dependent sugar dehydrogenase n=1 Tax=Lacipirellula sp. TaxID=2691419 RepID=UPI003D11F359
MHAAEPSLSAADEQARREYAEYALAHQGDVTRGKLVFERSAGPNCAKCHTVDGNRRFAGPDLSSIGDKFELPDLIRSILEPSATIAIGYGNTIVQTDAGTTHAGVMQRVTAEWLELLDENSRPVRIPASEVVATQESDVSLMPAGLEKSMTRDEFVDLLAYLQSLRQELGASASPSTPNEIPPCAEPVQFVPLFDASLRFDHPVWIGRFPGSDRRYVVLEHAGMSWIVEKTSTGDRRTPLLDLTRVVRRGGATGLLGFAFHPKFNENRRYFLKYHVVEAGQISTIVEERSFAPDFQRDSGQPPRQLLKIPSVTQDHNGGSIVFGPDGYLYIGTGDTGPQRDPRGHGQDLGSLLGKMLRIDVDQTEADKPYAIPVDNPFVDVDGVRPEIWAYGFREPWRYSFDRQTNDLWVGDVGQDRFEEVTLARVGENHGWNVFEGATPFSDEYRRENERFVPPVLSYPRRLGVSVTGGYVYRGARAPALIGRYVFGDFESRRLWALLPEGRSTKEIVEIGRSPTRIVSFAEDVGGELLMVGFDDGVIYRLDFDQVDLTPLETRTIAATAEQSPVLWRYSLESPSENWTADSFDDSNWSLAPGGFGTTGTPGAIVRTDWHARDIWLRRSFDLPTAPSATAKFDDREFALRIHHDEDAEIYLNGVEIARLPRWTSGYVEIPLTAEAISSLRAGRNVLAIHCRQNNGGQYIDAGIVEYVRPAKREPVSAITE